MGSKKTSQAEKTIEVKVKWRKDDDVPTIYANQLMVSHANKNEFFLFFGLLTPPIPLDKENLPKEIDIKIVSKIVVSPENMERFAEAIMKNLEVYNKDKKRSSKENQVEQ